jgi:hypothetical protein
MNYFQDWLDTNSKGKHKLFEGNGHKVKGGWVWKIIYLVSALLLAPPPPLIAARKLVAHH